MFYKSVWTVGGIPVRLELLRVFRVMLRRFGWRKQWKQLVLETAAVKRCRVFTQVQQALNNTRLWSELLLLSGGCGALRTNRQPKVDGGFGFLPGPHLQRQPPAQFLFIGLFKSCSVCRKMA